MLNTGTDLAWIIRCFHGRAASTKVSGQADEDTSSGESTQPQTRHFLSFGLSFPPSVEAFLSRVRVPGSKP